jgi:hypothetical protein
MSPTVPSRRGFQVIVQEEGTLTQIPKSSRHCFVDDESAGTGAAVV